MDKFEDMFELLNSIGEDNFNRMDDFLIFLLVFFDAVDFRFARNK